MYKDLLKTIDLVIEQHKNEDNKKVEVSESEAHYFIQGLQVAKQIVEQESDLVQDELAYEIVENVVRHVKSNLEKEQIYDAVKLGLDK